MLLLMICLLGLDTFPVDFTARYGLEEKNGGCQINLTSIRGKRASGWLVQEFREANGVTRWFATVRIDLEEGERFRVAIHYEYGEKRLKGGAVETWEMDQRRDEIGKWSESGDLKILPDTYKRLGPAKPAPKRLSAK